MEENYSTASVVVGRCHERVRWEADVSSVILRCLRDIDGKVRSFVAALVSAGEPEQNISVRAHAVETNASVQRNTEWDAWTFDCTPQSKQKIRIV